MVSEVVVEFWLGLEGWGIFFVGIGLESFCGGIEGYGYWEWVYNVIRWLCIYWFYVVGLIK